MDNFLAVLRNLGPARLAVLAVGIVALIGMMMALTMRMNATDYGLLYGNLNSNEVAQVTEMLTASNVPYDVRNGSSVFVPSDRVGQLRLQMAGQGVVGASVTGYELFDQSSGFGTTSLVQNINARRALEGELARTIASLPVVNSARVHLVLPERKLFSRENIQPTASVTINLGNRLLSEEQANSIVHLVAASVPNLKISDVTLVDTNGNLLSNNTSELTGMLTSREKMRRSLEASMERQIQNMLGRVVGKDKVSAEVTAYLNFDKLEESEEIFDPESGTVRSQQTIENQSNSQNYNGQTPVGVTGNIPGQTGQGAGGLSAQANESSSEETINYEISKRVRHFEKAQGALERLSVAVLVEGRYDNGTYVPFTEEQLQRFSSLIQSAVGFSASRGDTLEIADMPFSRDSTEEMEEPFFSKDDYFRMGEYALLLIGMFLVLFMIIRPVLNAIQTQRDDSLANSEAMMSDDGTLIAADMDEIEEMVELEKVEGQVKASSVKRVVSIIEKYPEESMAVIRNWMNPGE